MATLEQILDFGWPGAERVGHARPTLAEAYAVLEWLDVIVPKPTLQQILDLEAATDARLAEVALKNRRMDRLERERDWLLIALDAYGDALADLAQKVRTTSALDSTVVQRVQAIRNTINEAQSVT